MSLCKEKGERIGMAPDRLAGTAVDSVISWKSWSLTFFALDIFAWCCHCLLIWLALVIVESWQIFWLPACCLDVFFLPDISLSLSLNFLFWWSLSLHPVCACHLWILTAPLFLTAQEPTLFLADISFPTLFTPLLSSLLFPFCFLLSSVPYSLRDSLQLSTLHHLSTVFTSLLSWHLYSLHISTFFTPLPSSHHYSLAISTFFTSLRSSLLYFLHISTFFTSLLSTSLHSWHLIFTSLPYRPCNRV